MPRAAELVAPKSAADLIAAKMAALLLDQRGAWQLLGVSRSAFFRLKSAGLLPKPVRVEGVGVRYRRADLERWTEKLKPTR